jgi:hypothetical protein
MTEDQYTASAFRVGPLQGPSCSVFVPERSQIELVPSVLISALLQHPGFATLQEHAARVARSLPPGSVDLPAVREDVGRLVEAGVLVSKRELLAVDGGGTSPAGVRLATLAVPTRDRPAAVRRCLESFLAEGRRRDRDLELVVVDSTADPRAASAARAERRAWAAQQGVSLVEAGLEEKLAFARRLAAATGVDERLIGFALGDHHQLGAGDIGANRNALLLGLAGVPFLMTDDDTVADLRTLGAGPGLVLSGEADPTRISLFPDRPAIERAIHPAGADLFALIEGSIGRSPREIAGSLPLSSVSFEGVDRALVERLRAAEATVAAVSPGLWGDSGIRFPGFYLWTGSRMRAQLCQGERRYDELAHSREMVRQVEAPTLGSGGFVMSTCLALDGRQVLPPFTPVGRGEDLLFGQTLAGVSDGAFLAHLPCCVAHAPTDGRPARAPELWDRSTAVELPVIVGACLAMALVGIDVARGREARLRLLGAHLEALAEHPWVDLERMLRRQLWLWLARRLDTWDRELARHGASAPYWARDLRACRADLVEQARRRAPIVPAAFGRSTSSEGGAAALRSFIKDLGSLLRHWPTLIAGARKLRQSGVGLFTPAE